MSDNTRQRGQRRHRLQRGSSLAELSLSLVVILMLGSGFIDLGRAFFIKIAMDGAVSEGAHWAAIYPDCIPTANNALDVPYIKPECRGTNSILGRVINANKDLAPTRISDLSVTPWSAQSGDTV